jgi:DNA-binding NtrC family response regulator
MEDKTLHDRILVVDDEDGIRKALRIKLTKKGYEIIEAEDGIEATEILKKDRKFDMVLSDVKMPKMNGLELVEWIQEQGIIVPVVMLTGFIDLDTAVAAMKAGAFDYLTKPVRGDALLSAIERAISHKTGVETKIEEDAAEAKYKEELETMVKSQARTIIAMMELDAEETEHKEPKLILVAQPDSTRRQFLAQKLKAAGYETAAAGDGQEALEMDLGGLPDMIVTALEMDHMDGLDLTKLLKSKEATKDIKVLMIADETFSLDKMKELKGAGVDDFIKAPVDEEELLTKVALQLYQDKPEYLLDSLKDKGAFSGLDFKVDIFDYVQFLIMNRRQVILSIESTDKRAALLYLDRGNVVHAELGDKVGKEAFFECMRFKGGSFSTMPWKSPGEKTIDEVGDFLLMEAARIKDEMI